MRAENSFAADIAIDASICGGAAEGVRKVLYVRPRARKIDANRSSGCNYHKKEILKSTFTSVANSAAFQYKTAATN
jgi:hypothetical protein